jgi:hypothetical protein
MSSKRTGADPSRRVHKPGRAAYVHQILVVLANTDPLIWRRIQVPEDYTFWDLHVAIQDAMGWQDSHLHEFVVSDPRTDREQRLGLPGEEYADERPCLPGWQARVAHYLTEGRSLARYVYDFGDDWQHVISYEGTSPAEPGRRYPICPAGARACPPEDCGGSASKRGLTPPRLPDLQTGLSLRGERPNRRAQRRELLFHDAPDDALVHVRVSVDEQVAEGNDPIDLGDPTRDGSVALAQLRQGLADDLEPAFHRRSDQFVGAIGLEVQPAYESLDRVCGVEGILQEFR